MSPLIREIHSENPRLQASRRRPKGDKTKRGQIYFSENKSVPFKVLKYLRENRFDYEIIVAERDGPVAYTPEELYFGPLQMQARSPAFVSKWQHRLRHKQQTLSHFGRARHAVCEEKVQDLARQVRWITEVLA